MKHWEIVLYRANGRFVKSTWARSRYRAKVLRRIWEMKYDEAYFVEIHEVTV